MINKYKIIAELSNLIDELDDKGFIRAASLVSDILHRLVLENKAEDVDNDPEAAEIAKNIVGLQDSTVQNMNQGFSWEGFSSQYISTQ